MTSAVVLGKRRFSDALGNGIDLVDNHGLIKDSVMFQSAVHTYLVMYLRQPIHI
jgi:hypothetical protein